MLQFILLNVVLVSAGAVLFLVVRTLPRIGEDPTVPKRQTVFEKIVLSDIPHQIDTVLNGMMGKLFRKTKVQILRLDNYLTHKLKAMNAENGSVMATPKEFIEEMNGPLEEQVEKVDNSEPEAPVVEHAGNGKKKNGNGHVVAA